MAGALAMRGSSGRAAAAAAAAGSQRSGVGGGAAAAAAAPRLQLQRLGALPKLLAPAQRPLSRRCSSSGRRGAAAAVQVAASAQPQAQAAAAQAGELPAPLQKIVGSFQVVPDPMARYKQLLFYAKKLPPLPADAHAPANKVEGCVSQVWVVPELRADGRVYWAADSDSQLTKGLAALLVLGLSGCTPAEVLSVQPGFVELLGLKQSLTPSRNNGFLNMLKKMQRLTLALAAGADGGEAGAAASSSAASSATTASSDDGGESA